MPTSAPLYHGGRPGRVPGEALKTSRELGQKSHASDYAEYRDDRIYLTADLRQACFYAMAYFPAEFGPIMGGCTPLTPEQFAACGGAVYQVETASPLEHDEDSPILGLWVQVAEARVLSVVIEKVQYVSGIILACDDEKLVGTKVPLPPR